MAEFQTSQEVPTPPYQEPTSILLDQCRHAIVGARMYSTSSMKDGNHWSGEVRSNITLTAEYVFLLYLLELEVQEKDRAGLILFLENEQRSDGSWSMAPENAGDLSISSEAYFALKLLGLDLQSKTMKLARDFIVAQGGLGSLRVFTRIYFAMFGLLPWRSVPQLAPELILLPKSSYFSIYRFSSWVRATIVPLLVIAHHRPTFALPNGRSATNTYLDELWPSDDRTYTPYAPSLARLIKDQDWIGLGTKAADGFVFYQNLLGVNPLRTLAIRRCMEWIFEHQEPSGDWAGIFPPLHASIIAMYLEGVRIGDPRMVRALQAVERFAISDRLGKRVQPCVSAGWDTALMTIGLLDSRMPDDDGSVEVNAQIDKALAWIADQQNLGAPGDWRIYRPFINSGGFAFEYFNSWYPDVDDTQSSVIAFIKRDPGAIMSECVTSAVEWLLGMQNSDGGWAGFDYDNNNLYLNQIPFPDMEAFCDPSTSDVTGGVIECFGLILATCPPYVEKQKRLGDLLSRIKTACARALQFLID